MMHERIVVMEISRIEATHLTGLVTQFVELLEERADDAGDPAIGRLVPDAYPDDPDASRDFRSVTEDDLLARRIADARVVLETLSDDDAATDAGEPMDADIAEMLTLTLAPDVADAWMRTLAAVRLVLATRLGISDEDDHADDDPRFGVYDWVGFRLDGLVRAVSGEE